MNDSLIHCRNAQRFSPGSQAMVESSLCKSGGLCMVGQHCGRDPRCFESIQGAPVEKPPARIPCFGIHHISQHVVGESVGAGTFRSSRFQQEPAANQFIQGR